MQVTYHLKSALFGTTPSNSLSRQQLHNTQSVQGPEKGTVDQVEISVQGHILVRAVAQGEETEQSNHSREYESKDSDSTLNPQWELTEKEQQEVDNLKDRDREVRTHEQAHKAAAGGYASGGPSYEYHTGPDGKRYAVGGEVQIDTSPVRGDPQATIRKAQVVQQAAMAPAKPSGQDRRVAAEASRMEAKARQELTQQRIEQMGVERGNRLTVAEGTEEIEEESASTGNVTSETAALLVQIDQGVQQNRGQILDFFV